MDITLAGVPTNRALTGDQLSRVSIELSADGTEVGVGTIAIDDEAGTDEIAGGRRALIEEGATTISDGFIGGQDKSRNGKKDAPRREDLYAISDANVLFYGRRFVNRSRPSETDQDRVLAFAGLDLAAADTSWVLGTHTETLPAKKYTGSDWLELIQDVFEVTGKVVFLHDLADGSGRCLHSHLETEGHACGLTITDDLSSLDATTFAPWNANRNRSAGELVNSVYARDQAGRTALATDATSITNHDADGLKHGRVVDFEATSQAELQAKANAYIVENKDEIDIYDCDIGPLDEAALALIRPGDRITTTSQAMGVSASTIRIAHMTLTIWSDDNGAPVPGFWMAHLELNEAIRLRPRRPSGKRPTIPPPPVRSTCQETFARLDPSSLGVSELEGGLSWLNDTSCQVTGAEAILTDNAFPYLQTSIGTPFEIFIQQKVEPGAFLVGGLPSINCGVQFFEGNTPAFTGQRWAGYFFSINNSGGEKLDIDVETYSPIGGVTLIDHATVYTGNPVGFVFNTRVQIDPDGTCRVKAWPATANEPAGWTAEANGQGLSSMGSLALYLNTNSFLVSTARYRILFFRISEGFVCQVPNPFSGQDVTNERSFIGDGVTVAFTSHDPYVPGTLHMRVDGVPLSVGPVPPNDVEETDPAARLYTLADAPLDDAEGIIDYRTAL